MIVYSANGQQYYFSHYQVENGLSNNTVLCILQDQAAFMWFGTRDGLNRFDGTSFKVFRNNPKSTYSIGSNAIMSLADDNEQKMWIGTERGLFVFNRYTERFTQLKRAGNVSILSVKTIGDDVYYIALYTLYRYNKRDRSIKKFATNKEVTTYTIRDDGKIFAGTSDGLVMVYNEKTETFDKFYSVFDKSQIAVSKWIETIYEVDAGNFLIGTSNQGLKLLNINTGAYKDILNTNKDKTDIIVRDILKIDNNKYWIATESGIFIIDITEGVITKLERDYNDPYSISDNIVHSFYKDQQGGIWAGTYFGGVNYLPSQEILFKKYFHKPATNSISGNAISDIVEDKHGTLWIGTEDAGLNKLNLQTNRFTNYNPGIDNKSVTYSNIHSLLVNGDTLWAGTFLHGLDLISLEGKRLRNFNTGNTALGSNLIYDILRTKKGEIFVATEKGLFRYLPGINNFSLVGSVPIVFFRALSEDANGNIWAGTYGDGVYVFNPKDDNVIQHYSFASNNDQQIGSNIINFFYFSQSNDMWIATEGGLYKVDIASKQISAVNSENGFPSDITYAILEDNKKNLWISTSKGLVCYDPVTTNIRVFRKSQGLLTDQFNYRSAFRDNAGNMYFGSVKGMISFNPDSVTTNSFAPPVYITNFQVDNEELPISGEGSPLKQSIIFSKNIVLNHDQSSFSIGFAALDYSSPSSISYAYKMEGLEDNWTTIATNRQVYFTDLSPGNYTFNVKVLEPGGKNNIARLSIEILPPLWKTWWAYLSYFFLVTAIIFILTRFFIERSKIKNRYELEKLAHEKEKENYEDKINFFMNVAHEIKTPLTLIHGPMENIMDQINEMQVPGLEKVLH